MRKHDGKTKFTKEFKEEAIKSVIERESSTNDVSKRLREGTLHGFPTCNIKPYIPS